MTRSTKPDVPTSAICFPRCKQSKGNSKKIEQVLDDSHSPDKKGEGNSAKTLMPFFTLR